MNESENERINNGNITIQFMNILMLKFCSNVDILSLDCSVVR